MSNLTPFEIRLELLKMAKDLLTEEYYGFRDILINDWQMKVDSARLNNSTDVPDHPRMPEYPSEQKIIAKARTLNDFVSNDPTKF